MVWENKLSEFNSSDLQQFISKSSNFENKVNLKKNNSISRKQFKKINLDNTITTVDSLGIFNLKMIEKKFNIKKEDLIESMFTPEKKDD
jgi:hypothetical protein